MIKNIIGYCSRQFQVNLEDSGTTLSTITNPSINDEKCNRGYFFYIYFLNRGAIEAIAVFAKLQRPSGESLFEASVSSPCLTGVLRICFHILSSCSSGPYCSFASRVYNYIINEEGQPMFVGSHTSVLFYNRSISSWVWYGQYPQL